MGKIIAKSVSFSSISREISEKYSIPTLQRPYVWEAKKHVRKFLYDIYDNSEEYFIGSLVFVSSGEGTIGREEVIDGQQRITTIFLILFALRSLIIKQSFEKKLEDVLREINSFARYNDSFDNQEIIRLKFSDKNTDDYFSMILKKDPPDKTLTETQEKLKINFHYIVNELEKVLVSKKTNRVDILEIKKYFNKVKTLQIIGIICSDNTIAYELFESLNATGLSLANVDLIKNFVLKQLKGNQLVLRAEKKWADLEEIFSESRGMFKTFLRHQWISSGSYINHSGLYSAVEAKYKNSGSRIVLYLEEIFRDAIIYTSLRNANLEALDKLVGGKRNDARQIKEVLDFLRFLNVDQVYAPILFFYKKSTKEDFKKYINRLVAFQFLYKYIPGSPSSAEKIFADMSSPEKNKDQNKNFQRLEKLVKNEKDNFREVFAEKARYKEGNSGDLQFVLERYVFSKGGPLSFKEPTIEHIINQKGKINKEIHQLGNLTIFEKDVNSKMPDNVKDKIPFYKKSSYSEHKEIIKKYDFDKNYIKSIKRRTEDMSDIIFDIFFKILRSGKIK